MTAGVPCRAVLGAACWLIPAGAPLAQTSAAVDFGLSVVKYDGFLASGAGALTPVLAWDSPRAALMVRGTYLRFESGNRSLQGLVAGSLWTPAAHRWRGELSATAGASSYADFASFWHAIVEARVHRATGDGGAWVGGAAGRTSFGAAPRPAASVAIGACTQAAGLVLVATAGRAFIGDTSYTNVELTARADRAALTLEVATGARVWSRGGGRGVYGEGSAALTVHERLAIVVSGGRYPTDPIRGSIAGRYVTGAVRWQPRATPSRPRRPGHVWPAPQRLSSSRDTEAGTPRLGIIVQGNERVRLVVHAPGAGSVEIAGDFSDWQPVRLRAAGDGRWETVRSMARGMRRISVRVDGGAWSAPGGLTRAADDFGGAVGVFVVP